MHRLVAPRTAAFIVSLLAPSRAFAQLAPIKGAGSAAPLTAAPEPGRVPLQLESAGDAQIVGYWWRRSFLSGSYRGYPRYRSITYHQDLCATPCQLFAWPGGVPLYVRAEGMTTRALDLPVPPTGLRVRLGTPSEAAAIASMLLVTFGLVTAVTGGALLLPGFLGPDASLRLAGAVTAGAGGVLLVPGIVLAATMSPNVAWSGPPSTGEAVAPRASSEPPAHTAFVVGITLSMR
jgi:hypothetical protein